MQFDQVKKYDAAKLSLRVAKYYIGLLLSDSTIYTISSSSNGVVRAPSPYKGRHRRCSILQCKLLTHVHHTLMVKAIKRDRHRIVTRAENSNQTLMVGSSL